MTKTQLAAAFAAGRPGKCHNAEVRVVDGEVQYLLHGNRIATRRPGDAIKAVSFDWCGWYTTTTASHMNEILKAIGWQGKRFSYAKARDGGEQRCAVTYA